MQEFLTRPRVFHVERSSTTEGAGAFRPLDRGVARRGASAPGRFAIILELMPLVAPQELRTYFITAVTANRRRLFQVEEKAQLLVDTLKHYRNQSRFKLHAFVVMPDHLHALLTPAPDVSLEKAVQFIKGGYSFRLKSKLDVWSRSFNETQIRDLREVHCVQNIY